MKNIFLFVSLFGFATTQASDTQKKDAALDILFSDPNKPDTPTTHQLVAVLGFPKSKSRSTSATPPTSPTKEETKKQAPATVVHIRFFFTQFAPKC